MVKISQNSQRYPETTETKFSDVLMHFSESLMNIDNEGDILWNLAKNCISKLGFIDCVVYLLDELGETMIQKAAYGPKNPKNFEIYAPVDRPLGTGIVGHVAKSGIAELIHDTSKDKRYRMDDEFRLSEVCVPIIIDGQVIGIIDCEHPDKYFFTEHHLHMLLTISSICAIKLKEVRLHKKYINQQEQALKIQKQLAELKLKALSTQLNPHFVFNALNAIQHFITSENKKLALEYLSAFSKLIRFYLKNINKDAVKLKDEIDTLHWYLKLQKLRYNKHLEFNIAKDQSKVQQDAIIPSFIIQTLFENLIEHGIFNQYKNQKLNICYTVKSEYVVLDIEYNYSSTQKTNSYKPEYREQLVQWQDQIRLLNKVKQYNIKKEVTFVKDKDINGGHIIIQLPNLK